MTHNAGDEVSWNPGPWEICFAWWPVTLKNGKIAWMRKLIYRTDPMYITSKFGSIRLQRNFYLPEAAIALKLKGKL